MGIAGKVALVTGGSRGIGAAIATRLAEEGADVALTYNSSAERAQEVAGKIGALGRKSRAIPAPARDMAAVRDAVTRTVDEFGRLDILVNSAGIFPTGRIDEIGLDQFDEAIDVHLRSVFVAVRAAVDHLGDGGRIISIGSCLAEYVGTEGLTSYATSKSALSGFTKAIARDLAPRGITANLVHPGNTDTEMNPASGADQSKLASIPIGHYGAAEDIAATVAHLAGDGGKVITGTAITVDGGVNA
ncbi:SDR family NAD(P)-dependent oxidoreductase [Sciscionella sediminilitoris]|uniref:SDR family NAD(P)-dependent oxidoreductase n=1 Tax=Sciscionella sediminilitoris TaxID=1445613 RepID=UPI0004DF92AB|nr:SDR family oxidoreductase [Sciscionella sp. SE31]